MNPVRDTMCYVYLLQDTGTKSWYTGSTRNLRKRLVEHQQGKSQWTKSRGPWKLIYYEACLDEADARLREIYLKTGMGKRYLNNRMKRFLSLTG